IDGSGRVEPRELAQTQAVDVDACGHQHPRRLIAATDLTAAAVNSSSVRGAPVQYPDGTSSRATPLRGTPPKTRLMAAARANSVRSSGVASIARRGSCTRLNHSYTPSRRTATLR